jgi:hypothetical protein
VAAESGVTPRAGRHMMRTYLNRETSSTPFRTEASLGSPGEFKKGTEYWLGISVFLPQNWDLNYGGGASDGIVWQFHGRQYLDPTWRETLPITAMHTSKGWLIKNFHWTTRSARVSATTERFRSPLPTSLGNGTTSSLTSSSPAP